MKSQINDISQVRGLNYHPQQNLNLTQINEKAGCYDFEHQEKINNINKVKIFIIILLNL